MKKQIVVNDSIVLDNVELVQGKETKCYHAVLVVDGLKLKVTYDLNSSNLVIADWYKLNQNKLPMITELVKAIFNEEKEKIEMRELIEKIVAEKTEMRELIEKFVEEHKGERFDITLLPKHEHDVDRIDINNAEIGFENNGEHMVITSKRGESSDIIGRLLVTVEDIITLIDFESEYGKDFEEKIDLLYEKYPGYRDGDNSTCYLETKNFYTIYMEKGIF